MSVEDGRRLRARLPSVQKPLGDAAIAINTTVAQKRPVAADVFQVLQIALSDQNLFLVMRSFNDDPSKGIAKKRSAPEFQAFALGAIAADIAELMAHAVDHADKNAIGDGVCALDGAPGIVLRGAELGFFVRVPADCRRIKKDIRALQCGKAGAFGIPLVPADKSSHASVLGVKGLEAEIARSEVKLLVIKRIVRDVHLAIEALGAAIGVKTRRRCCDKGRVRAAQRQKPRLLSCFAGDGRKSFRGWARDGLSQIKKRSVFTLAEILRAEKLRQADHLRALLGGRADFFRRPAKVVVGVGRAMHLNQANGKRASGSIFNSAIFGNSQL